MIGELSNLKAGDVDGMDGDSVLELVFERLSGTVWRDHSRDVAGQSLGVRLDALIRVLTEQDFYPSAEVVEDTLRIHLVNCPFRSVALRSKAVCAFDSAVIASMLDIDMTQEMCIHDGANGCVYQGHIGAERAKELAATG